MSNKYVNYINQAANSWGVDPTVLNNIARLESSYRPNVQNNWDNNATKPHPTPSYGMFQLIEPTFDSYYDQAFSANPKAFTNLGAKNWHDWRQQAQTTAWAIKNGHGGAWATFANAGGNSPSKGLVGQGGVDLPSRHESLLGGDSGALQDIKSKYEKYGNKAQILLGDEPGILQAYNKGLAKNLQHEVDAIPKAGTSTINYAGPGAVGGSGIWGSVGSLPRGQNELAYQYLQRLGHNLFGLRNDPGDSQTTGGHHAQGSDHYSGLAVDFGNALNSQSQLNAWKKYLQEHSQELGVKQILDEGDHVHASLSRNKKH